MAHTVVFGRIYVETKDGKREKYSIENTPFGIIWKKQKLPNGREAEQTYLILNRPFDEIKNISKDKPYNFKYEETLRPIPSRWYRLISTNAFAALQKSQQKVLGQA